MLDTHLRRACPALLILLLSFSTASAQNTEREKAIKEIEALREQIKAKEKVLLAPPTEDEQAYAEFLRQPETGLVRLLPREKYDRKLTINGGGAYYSFSKLTQEYGYSSDIELQQNSLGVGFAGADFGFLCLLGDVALEEVTIENAGAQFLSNYAAPTVEQEAREAYRRAAAGFQVGDFVYKSRLPVQVGATYLLRSVSYERADSLVAFRVIRKDTDESVVLLWKMLKRFTAPRLAPDKTAKM